MLPPAPTVPATARKAEAARIIAYRSLRTSVITSLAGQAQDLTKPVYSTEAAAPQTAAASFTPPKTATKLPSPAANRPAVSMPGQKATTAGSRATPEASTMTASAAAARPRLAATSSPWCPFNDSDGIAVLS